MFLDKSTPINTIAWLPNNPPSPIPTAIYLSGSSEFNQNEVSLTGIVISTATTPYIIAQISASYIPAAGGWYLLDVYGLDADLLSWNQSNVLWQDTNYTWDSVGITNDVFSTLRVFVSGSNTPTITEFISSNESGSFTRYISTNETASFDRYISGNETGSFTRYTSSNETGSFSRYISGNEHGYFYTKQF
jgi:hypothetical protein